MSQAAAGKIEPEALSLQWAAAGTSWLIHVKKYNNPQMAATPDPERRRQEQALRVVKECDITVTVLAPREVKGMKVARFLMTLDESEAMAESERELVVEVLLDSGVPFLSAVESAQNWTGGRSSIIDPGGGQRWLFSRLVLFPIDWVAKRDDLLNVPSAERTLTLRNEVGDSVRKKLRPGKAGGIAAVTIEAGAGYGSASGRSHRVEQTWVPGEPWWRSFRRYRNGRLDIEAVRVIPESSEEDSPETDRNKQQVRKGKKGHSTF